MDTAAINKVDVGALLEKVAAQELWKRVAAGALLLGALVVTLVVGPTEAIIVATLALMVVYVLPGGRRLFFSGLILKDKNGAVRLVAAVIDDGTPSVSLLDSTSTVRAQLLLSDENAVLRLGGGEGESETLVSSFGARFGSGSSTSVEVSAHGGRLTCADDSRTASLVASDVGSGILIEGPNASATLLTGSDSATLRLNNSESRVAVVEAGGPGADVRIKDSEDETSWKTLRSLGR